MQLLSRNIIIFSVLGFITYGGINSSFAGSVYAIPDHWTGTRSIVNVYEILSGNQKGELEYKENLDLKYDGAADVGIDIASDILFFTFELQKKIEIVNARTLLSEGEVLATGATNLAGLVVDQVDPNTIYLYTIDRSTNHLFCYDWDAENKKLTLITPEPNLGDPWHVLLVSDPNLVPEGVKGGGLSMDSSSGILYVSQFSGSGSGLIFTPYVNVFDRNNNWKPLKTIDLGEGNYAVDIDGDWQNGYLFAGGYNYNGRSHDNLIRYDLNDPNGTQLKDIGAGVIGVAVDPNNPDFVYLTTYNNQIEAWNVSDPCSFYWQKIDYEADGVSGPAGICVANVDYVPPFSITKTDDIDNCVPPRGDEVITYTITLAYQWTDPADPLPDEDVTVVDELPDEVDFVSATADGVYDSDGNTVTWQVAPEDLDEPIYFEIVVRLNNTVMPGNSIENMVTVTGIIRDNEYSISTNLSTNICCCGNNYGEIIYVDESAAGNNDGASWTDAYLELTDALERAFPCDQVWVAQGTYKPSSSPSDPNTQVLSFPMVQSVALLGGFPAGGGNLEDRNWINYETILSGHIDDGPYGYVYEVVKAENIFAAILDGFIITDGLVEGLSCINASPTICHNKIKENHWGIVIEGRLSAPVIKNNWIYNNQAEGILLNDPNQNTIIRNNTIVANGGGICLETGSEPVISNCIFRFHPEANDVVNCTVKYSCLEDTRLIYDPTDPNSINRHNICTDPNFVDVLNNDYHLNAVSPCIDAGDPDSACGLESDIDGQYRIINDNIDMGADEYCPGTDSNPADFNADGAVDLLDYSELANVWLLENTDPGWNALYDLVADNAINLPDLDAFSQNWLWLACWNNTPQYFSSSQNMSMSMGLSLPLKQTLASTETSLPSAPLTSEQQIQLLMGNITFLEEIWESSDDVRQTFTPQQWSDWMKSISNQILELEGE